MSHGPGEWLHYECAMEGAGNVIVSPHGYVAKIDQQCPRCGSTITAGSFAAKVYIRPELLALIEHNIDMRHRL